MTEVFRGTTVQGAHRLLRLTATTWECAGCTWAGAAGSRIQATDLWNAVHVEPKIIAFTKQIGSLTAQVKAARTVLEAIPHDPAADTCLPCTVLEAMEMARLMVERPDLDDAVGRGGPYHPQSDKET